MQHTGCVGEGCGLARREWRRAVTGQRAGGSVELTATTRSQPLRKSFSEAAIARSPFERLSRQPCMRFACELRLSSEPLHIQRRACDQSATVTRFCHAVPASREQRVAGGSASPKRHTAGRARLPRPARQRPRGGCGRGRGQSSGAPQSRALRHQRVRKPRRAAASRRPSLVSPPPRAHAMTPAS